MEFFDAKGFETYFKVSKCGKVYSKRSNKILKTVITKKGYETFSTRLAGRVSPAKVFRIHRLIAETFLPNPENKPFVNHINLDKLDNNVENLEWCTHRENTDHAQSNGVYTGMPGIKNPNSKLTQEQVDEIRVLYKKGHRKYGGRALASKYNVHYNVINEIGNNKRYKI